MEGPTVKARIQNRGRRRRQLVNVAVAVNSCQFLRGVPNNIEAPFVEAICRRNHRRVKSRRRPEAYMASICPTWSSVKNLFARFDTEMHLAIRRAGGAA